MKKQIRLGVFETNSSSCHTLSICSREEFNRWKAGELLFKRWDEEFVEADSLNPDEDDEDDYQTYYEWRDDEYLEIYVKDYTTESGDKIVVFGKYGYDG